MKAAVLITGMLLTGLAARAEEACWVSHHDCGILQTPAPGWPEGVDRTEADCTASYTVGEDGRAHDATVTCTDPRFVDAVLKSVGDIEYPVTDGCNRTCQTIGKRQDYPVLFRPE